MTPHNRTGRDKNNSQKALPKGVAAAKGNPDAQAASAASGQLNSNPGNPAGAQPAGKQSGPPGSASKGKPDQANRSSKDMPGREPSKNGRR